MNYEKLYDLGMDAYKEEKWSKCSEFFENAINDFHFYKTAVIDCRLKCKGSRTGQQYDSLVTTFHEILQLSNCLRRCKKKKLGERAEEEISSSVDKKFEDRNPYNYLQFCYFKEGKLAEAASAAFTYYIVHQDDSRILGNLQYYRTLSEISEKDFVDLERKPYQKQYIEGLMSYNEGNWKEAATAFENSLSLYYKEEERCRASCEKGFTHNGFPDFINAIADHYITVIVCQQKCLRKLSIFGMEELENFVQEHYNYLQFAYYESNNFEKAFESIASFLLFQPHNEEMLANKDYYIKTLRYKEEAFVPSKDAVRYVELWKEIDRSLSFVRDKYTLPRDQIEEEGEEDASNSEDVASAENVDGKQNSSRNVKKFENIGIQLVQEGKQLKGKDRFVADGFIREDQCEALADLARSKQFDELGNREITVSEVIELIRQDEGYEISLRLLLRATEVMKAYMSLYFIEPELKVSKVKVICRSPGAKSDDALPSDCILQESGDCGNTQDVNSDYMAVAYLTDMKDGTGQFFFTDKDGDIQASVEPLCGLVVGFTTSDKHKVNLPWKQERCALIVSLTSEKSDTESQSTEIERAKETLSELEKQRVEEFSIADNTEILKEFRSQGVEIVQDADKLLGKERFVADGLSTPDECDTLIKLAKQEGVSGDGYRGRVSPHTENEIFTGLDMKHGDQLVRDSQVSPGTLELFLDISEHARLLVEKYLNLTQPLYFDYTHLVCRTAIEGDTDREADLSHPVHSDNCMIQPDGSCIPDAFAYVQRHYSAVLYLNDNFEGGQFFFAHRNKSEQIALEPKCGRLVAFNAGDYHGVKAVTKGQRCAIAMWFTHDPNFVEVSRKHARRTLENIRQDQGKIDKLTEKETSLDVDSETVDQLADLDSVLDENHDEL